MPTIPLRQQHLHLVLTQKWYNGLLLFNFHDGKCIQPVVSVSLFDTLYSEVSVNVALIYISLWKAEFNSIVLHMGFMVNKWHWSQFFSEDFYCCLPLPIHIYHQEPISGQRLWGIHFTPYPQLTNVNARTAGYWCRWMLVHVAGSR
jgi:hypothetical protein